MSDILANIFNWFSQWGPPQIAVAVVLGIIILKFVLGGRSSSSSNTTVLPSGSNSPARGGFPTSMYTGSRKLSNFSVDKSVYDFKTPSPTPNTSSLRKPASPDMDLAKKMFLRSFNTDIAKKSFGELEPQGGVLNMDKARDLFIPHFNSNVEGKNGDEEV
jgi:hypothetical protein